ncbi:MAG: hypothetical protein MI810_19340 [Flavobacteriales bacterium]|nr:hypothetical protein [Flavobacteriales bacterium]
MNWRWKLVNWLTLKATDMSALLLRDRKWNYQLQDFAKMPINSLGRKLYEYLTQNRISYKPNLVRHDVKHILLGYEMKMPDELHIHAFLMGNRSHNLMGTIYVAVCLVFVPEQFFKLKKDYLRGKAAVPFRSVDFRNFLQTDLKLCRKQLNILT